METDFYIPRELDAKPLVLLWEFDTVAVVLIVFLIFAMLGGVVPAVILCFFVGKGWVRLKEYGGDGMLIKMFYWLFYSDFFVKTPKYRSEVREFIG